MAEEQTADWWSRKVSALPTSKNSSAWHSLAILLSFPLSIGLLPGIVAALSHVGCKKQFSTRPNIRATVIIFAVAVAVTTMIGGLFFTYSGFLPRFLRIGYFIAFGCALLLWTYLVSRVTPSSDDSEEDT